LEDKKKRKLTDHILHIERDNANLISRAIRSDSTIAALESSLSAIFDILPENSMFSEMHVSSSNARYLEYTSRPAMSWGAFPSAIELVRKKTSFY
jgi:hypothetical protein